MAVQVKNGKAFEYSLLIAIYDRLKYVNRVQILENGPYNSAKSFFESFSELEQDAYRLNSSAAVNFLIDLEPRLVHGVSDEDIVQLEIVSDTKGQSGDVRDVIAIRALQKWEIGISAKNNHKAVKHSRLSNSIDFGMKWLGYPCSQTYFEQIRPVFDNLSNIQKQSGGTKKWSSLGNYPLSVYVPVLDAFKLELHRLWNTYGDIIIQNLVLYLIGNKDFYKVIKQKNAVEIQAYNLLGTLNQPFGSVKPKGKINRLKLPSRLIEIVYATNSLNTLIVSMNEGWQISFRIHNASSRVEPSLKFDINLISTPSTLFTNHILHK